MSGVFVSPHAADDAVGEVAFVRASGFSSGLAFRGFTCEIAARVWDFGGMPIPPKPDA